MFAAAVDRVAELEVTDVTVPEERDVAAVVLKNKGGRSFLALFIWSIFSLLDAPLWWRFIAHEQLHDTNVKCIYVKVGLKVLFLKIAIRPSKS